MDYKINLRSRRSIESIDAFSLLAILCVLLPLLLLKYVAMSSTLLEESDAAEQLLPYAKQAEAVDEAVTQALELVKTYADPKNPAWKDGPDQIYKELDQARYSIVRAWDELQVAMSKQEGVEDETKETSAETDKEGLRVAYIDMITDAFADVLDNLRQNDTNDPIDVDVLVDCLQSGLDLMNTTATGSLSMGDLSFDEGDTDTTGNTITPHESRRRQLGFRQLNDMAA